MMNIADFDFDKWRELAQSSPEQFERERRCAVERLIKRGKNSRQLQGLQCRIDLERSRARTPLKSCLRLSTLMWDAFLDFSEVMNEEGLAAKKVTSPKTTSAKIIPFRHD